MRILFIYMAAIALSLITCDAKGETDIYVDFPPSDRPGFEKLCVTVNGCETCSFVKKDELEQFAEQIYSEKQSPGKQTLREKLVLAALNRSKNGCK